MLKFLKSLFRRKPVVIQTYKRDTSEITKKRRELHKQMARELGLPEPEFF